MYFLPTEIQYTNDLILIKQPGIAKCRIIYNCSGLNTGYIGKCSMISVLI